MPKNDKETALATVDDDENARQIVRRKRNRPDLEKFGEENTKGGMTFGE